MAINHREARWATGPYDYEYIASRPEGEQWRVRDRNDNAVGSAATESEARKLAEGLNRQHGYR